LPLWPAIACPDKLLEHNQAVAAAATADTATESSTSTSTSTGIELEPVYVGGGGGCGDNSGNVGGGQRAGLQAGQRSTSSAPRRIDENDYVGHAGNPPGRTHAHAQQQVAKQAAEQVRQPAKKGSSLRSRPRTPAAPCTILPSGLRPRLLLSSTRSPTARMRRRQRASASASRTVSRERSYAVASVSNATRRGELRRKHYQVRLVDEQEAKQGACAWGPTSTSTSQATTTTTTTTHNNNSNNKGTNSRVKSIPHQP
jgi:hypothetical protein